MGAASGRPADRCPFTSSLQVPPCGLFPFHSLEQCFEIPLAEALGSLALDDLVEERRAVLHRLAEDLEQVAFIIPIDQDAELSQRGKVFIDAANSIEDGVIIRAGNLKELHPPVTQRGHRLYDVVGGDSQMLDPGSTIEVEVLVDLRLLTTLGRLIDGELDPVVAAGYGF